jgi:hypothetical protein
MITIVCVIRKMMRIKQERERIRQTEVDDNRETDNDT